MTAKEFLEQYKYAVLKAKRCREAYQEATEKIDTVRSTLNTDGTPHGSGISRKTEDVVIKLIEAGNKYLEAEEQAQCIKEEIENVINSLPPGYEAQILYERYIHLEKWETVASLLMYSLPNVFRLHGKALAEVEELLKTKNE
jgi:hypothetical protein